MDITVSLVKNLIAEQFSQWAHLPIRPVPVDGWDNRTFRLGDDMLVRLPSAEGYAMQVPKEQQWLPILMQQLSFSIPQPLAMGKPTQEYPFHWSIYRWLEGYSANTLEFNDTNLNHIAGQLAQFLQELRSINATGGPLAGTHNYCRGDSPAVYDAETRAAIAQLRDVIDADAATAVWEKAISTIWCKPPVWLHGDFSAGNILIKDGRLTAVIDFGCMGIGDPACDLVIAWTFLKNKSREIFRSQVGLDPDTWARARGWALWKALITLVRLEDKMTVEADKQLEIIQSLLQEHRLVQN